MHSKVREATESPYNKGWSAVSEKLLKLLPQGSNWALPSEDLILSEIRDVIDVFKRSAKVQKEFHG